MRSWRGLHRLREELGDGDVQPLRKRDEFLGRDGHVAPQLGGYGLTGDLPTMHGEQCRPDVPLSLALPRHLGTQLTGDVLARCGFHGAILNACRARVKPCVRVVDLAR